MESREVIKLWDCKTDVQPRPLRRPNSTASSENVPDNATSQSPQAKYSDTDFSILTKSRLRVDAKEWFPSSYIPNNNASVNLHSAQNRLQKFKTSLEPPEGGVDPSVSIEMRAARDTSRLEEIIRSLTLDPGQFDSVVNIFTTVLSPYYEDVFVMTNAAELIFMQALYESNFRYNAARLCSAVEEHCPLFRSHLHILCEKELQAYNHPQGLTLFLAELYMQLHYENIYGRSLLESIRHLITLGKPDDIKCICQTLKLAGYSLDLYSKEALDAVFVELEAIRPSLPPPLISLLDSVFALRNNQWGHATSQPGITNSLLQEQNGYRTSLSEDGFVVYMPDGEEISTEEQEFLRANFEDPNDYMGDESSDPDDLFDPEPEMDEEIRAAFREFVKMGRR